MASEITVQTIRAPASGENANKILIPSGQVLDIDDWDPPAGTVVQYQYATDTAGAYLAAISAYTTLMSITVTPKYANSKIIIQHVASGIQKETTSTLARILKNQSSVDTVVYYNTRWTYCNDVSYWSGQNFGFTCTDSISSTDEITYSLQAYQQTTGTSSNTRWNDSTDNPSTAYIHVWEIRQ